MILQFQDFKKYFCQQHLVTFYLCHLRPQKKKRDEENLSKVGTIHGGAETKSVFVYVLLLKQLKGVWRVCFYSPPHRLLLFLLLFVPRFFLKLAPQEGELWAFISEWKACGWHPEQRGLSAWPQQTSVPGLYSKDPGAGERGCDGKEEEVGRRQRGGGTSVWLRDFKSWRVKASSKIWPLTSSHVIAC